MGEQLSPSGMLKKEWRKQFKNCPEKIRFRVDASDGSGALLWKINKKGERVPRLTHTYCNLLWPISARCRFTKCPLVDRVDHPKVNSISHRPKN
jgi:hypothetical protein